MRIVLGVLISGVLAALAIYNLHLGQVAEALKQAHYEWVAVGLLVYLGGALVRALRWRYLLLPAGPLRMTRLFQVVCIGFFGNNVYPARAGELLKAYVLKQREEISMSAALGTITLERLFDSMLIVFFVVISSHFGSLPAWIRQLSLALGILFLFVLAILLGLVSGSTRFQRLPNFVILRLVPASRQVDVRGILERFRSGLRVLIHGRRLSIVILLSFVVWSMESLNCWFVMKGFHFKVSFDMVMFLTGVLALVTTVPSLPGYVGTFDVAGILVLGGLGVSRDLAAGYTVVLHALIWLPMTLLGGYFMWLNRRDLTFSRIRIWRRT